MTNSLASAINQEQQAGGVLESQTATTAVIRYGKKTNHVLHAILSLLTAGLWLIVWLVLVVTRKQRRVFLLVNSDGSVSRTEGG